MCFVHNMSLYDMLVCTCLYLAFFSHDSPLLDFTWLHMTCLYLICLYLTSYDLSLPDLSLPDFIWLVSTWFVFTWLHMTCLYLTCLYLSLLDFIWTRSCLRMWCKEWMEEVVQMIYMHYLPLNLFSLGVHLGMYQVYYIVILILVYIPIV